ncbi:hypothetical protein [Streptomyces sp. TRM64462]|uniref:hypothetical protein n=1 Tax=Streptomyces sp. TRM64462 TaxID=2741726 RepID=UPI0015868519|nr:hypothetical protein [Streptomyces sp. TRM64462]
MRTELRETAAELAALLWREHTVYRERTGGVVIRGEHVRRWISLAPRGTRDEILVRAGRILDGGTTAPARSEVVVSLGAGRDELAAVCRRLLAEAAAGPEPSGLIPRQATSSTRGGRRGGTGREGRTGRTSRLGRRSRPAGRAPERAPRSRHTGLVSWLIILSVLGAVGLYVYLMAGSY